MTPSIFRPSSARHAVALIIAFAFIKVFAAEAERRHYDVAAGEAATSLQQIANISGADIQFLPSDVSGLHTNAVQGNLTVDEALEQLLAGSSLRGVRKDERSFTVQPDSISTSPVEVVAGESSSVTSGKREEVLVLSPFEVVADTRGYLAANTISGTRFNTKIADLGASITVVTKQQMLDLAALDINDVLLYEANTEGSGNYTAIETSRNGEVEDLAQQNPQGVNRIRGMESANVARGSYASNSRIPIDPYNTEGIEISRGPNSTIFGLGNASGVINIIPSRAALNKTNYDLTLRGDSSGGYRSSIDFNHPLWKDKLAVRVAALYDSKGFERKPSEDITRRQQGMLTFQPFKKTTIRASYERYSNFARRPNSITPRDVVTYWKAAGSPTWDPITYTAKIDGVAIGTYTATLTTLDRNNSPLPLALWEKAGFHNRSSMYIDGAGDGGIAFWTQNNTTSGTNLTLSTNFTSNRYVETGTEILRRRPTTMPHFVSPGITDKELYDWEHINFVAPNYATDKAKTGNIEIEQFFINTPEQVLAAQAGWFYEDSTNYSRNIINATSSYLFVDVNERLLDGNPNPYFLRPYIGSSEPSTRINTLLNDNVRAQLVYQLDLRQRRNWLKWLGKNSVSGYAEQRLITSGLYRYREAVLDDHTWVNSANRANSGLSMGRAYYRYYVGDDQGQNIDYSPPPFSSVDGNYNFHWYNPQSKQWIDEPAVFGLTGYTPSILTRQEIRTKGVVVQSSLFNDQLVLTAGWRHDDNRVRDSVGAELDPATGLVNYNRMEDWLAWIDRGGPTTTRGAVLRPFSGWQRLKHYAEGQTGIKAALIEAIHSLSFHYNQSDSFQPVLPQYTLFGELLPNPTAEGKDYGFSFSLFEGKLYAKVNLYKNKQINTPKGDAGTIATRVLRLDTGRGPGGRDSPPFNLEEWAWDVVANRHDLGQSAINIVRGNNPEAIALAQQYQSEVDEILGIPKSFIENFVGRSVAETQDLTASGMEVELNYNPTRFWTVKLTGAQQKAVDSNVSPNIQAYIDMRMPVWLSVKDDNGVSWWTSTNAATHFYQQVDGPLKVLSALQGKPRSQVREWRFNLITRYDLAGISENRWLKNLSLGTAVRWEDKASIGWLGGPPDANGVILTLDKNKPVYDSARTYVDLMAYYRLNLGKDIKARVQLNVRNAFEGGRLQAIGVNPDGNPHTFRIIDPRQFILSTTFEF